MLDRAARLLAAPLTTPAPSRPAKVRPAAVAVLGAPAGRGPGLPPVLAERFATGVDLYCSGLADLICLTGTRAETDAMAAAAERLGIPNADLVIDREARNTRDNARHVSAILTDMGRSSVWVATQPFHSRRACFWFRRFGLVPLPGHRPNSLQYDDPRRAVRWIAREYVSWANLGIRMLLG